LAVLWWAYDISPLIRGGYYDRHQALRIVTKMGLVITVLTGFVWLFRMRRDIRPPILRGAWTAAWQTGLILIGYSALILARLQFGKFSTPLPDKAFLPILGALTAISFRKLDRWRSSLWSRQLWAVFLAFSISFSLEPVNCP
jgi:hypothetical protein